jgi:hypothetical protein
MFAKKVFVFFVLLLVNFFCEAQSISVLPLYVSPNFDIIDGHVNINNKFNFIYANFEWGFPPATMVDSNKLMLFDSAIYEVRQIDFSTGNQKVYKEKYKADTTFWPVVFEPFYNKYNARIYLNNSKISVNTIYDNQFSFNIHRYFNIVSFDSNLLNRTSVQLPIFLDSARSYFQANKLIYKDSFIYAINCDTALKTPYLCKFDLNDGHFLDSLKMVNRYFDASFFTYYKKLDLLNDSTMVCLSSDYISFVNLNSMKLIDTFPLKWTFFTNVPKIGNVKFNATDSSYIFNGGHYITNFYYKISAKGFITKIFEVPVAQISALDNRLNFIDNYNWDFMYPNHIYTALRPIAPLTDSIVLFHSNMAGITDWIRFIKLPEQGAKVTVTAMNDSSVIGIVNVFKAQPANANDLYDAYYFKVDKNGNQIFPLKVNEEKPFDSDLVIYPNPTSNNIYLVNLHLTEIVSMKLIDSKGVFVKKIAPSLMMSLDEIATGNYFLCVETKTKRIVRSVIKQ